MKYYHLITQSKFFESLIKNIKIRSADTANACARAKSCARVNASFVFLFLATNKVNSKRCDQTHVLVSWCDRLALALTDCTRTGAVLVFPFRKRGKFSSFPLFHLPFEKFFVKMFQTI